MINDPNYREYRLWSEWELSTLRSMYAIGRSDEEIARAIDRTTGAVSCCRQAHKIVRPREFLRGNVPWSSDELSLARVMYSQGCSLEDIAEATGRTKIAVKRFVGPGGLTRDPDFIPDISVFDTDDERWMWIKAASGYAVSSLGRVISMKPGNHGLLLSMHYDKDGYQHVQTSSGGKSKRCAVHRLVAVTFIGDPPTDHHLVAHGDGVRSNNRISNLRWATPAENYQDSIRHGVRGRLRVTARQVRDIKISPLYSPMRQWA